MWFNFFIYSYLWNKFVDKIYGQRDWIATDSFMTSGNGVETEDPMNAIDANLGFPSTWTGCYISQNGDGIWLQVIVTLRNREEFSTIIPVLKSQ